MQPSTLAWFGCVVGLMACQPAGREARDRVEDQVEDPIRDQASVDATGPTTGAAAPLPPAPASGLNGRVLLRGDNSQAIVGARVCARLAATGHRKVRTDLVDTCTPTDAGGVYSLELGPGSYRVAAAAEGYIARAELVVLSSASPAARQEFALEPGGRLREGQVVDTLGRPIVGARVEAVMFHDRVPIMERSVLTDAQGRFRMWSSGWDVLFFEADGYARGPGVPTAGRERDEPVFALMPESNVSGRVLDAEGRPVANARVWQTGSLGAHDFGNAFDARRTDAEGRFAFAGLTSGEITLFALSDRQAGMLTVQTSYAERREVELHLRESVSLLRARVVERGGEAPPRCSVSLRPLDERWSTTVMTDHEGVFEALGRSESWEVTGVKCRGFIGQPPYPRLVPDAELRTIEVVRGATLRGRLVDVDGRPLGDRTVELGWRRSSDTGLDRDVVREFMQQDDALTDDDGRFAIAGLWPGEYEVIVDHDSTMEAQPIIARVGEGEDAEQQFVTWRIDAAEVEDAPAPRAEPSITVTVLGPDGSPAHGAVVATSRVLRPGALWRGDGVTGPDGRVSIPEPHDASVPISAARPGEFGEARLDGAGDLVIRLRELPPSGE